MLGIYSTCAAYNGTQILNHYIFYFFPVNDFCDFGVSVLSQRILCPSHCACYQVGQATKTNGKTVLR